MDSDTPLKPQRLPKPAERSVFLFKLYRESPAFDGWFFLLSQKIKENLWGCRFSPLFCIHSSVESNT